MTFDIALLKDRFRSRLLERIEVLAGHVRSGIDPEAATRAFHNIAGVAGSVGYHEATIIARQGEALCTDSPDASELLTVLLRLRESVATDSVG